MSAHMRLRRADGRVYLNRWGIEHDRIGGIFIHKMSAPDPGIWLHDHPWVFWRLILWGGYVEKSAGIRDHLRHSIAAGVPHYVNQWSWSKLDLSKCHTITSLFKRTSWSLVVHGPKRTDREPGKLWGFYTPEGWEPGSDYRTRDRDLYNDIGAP